MKNCMLTVLFLTAILANQLSRAESPSPLVLNAGFNDAWYNPDSSGQGFLITVFPNLNLASLAWFTYDTSPPAEGETAQLGSPGHRWLLAVGAIDGNQSIMNIDLTSGGLFDMATEVQHTDPPGSDGTITLTFEDCSSGIVDYDIPPIDRQGSVPIQRVASDNITLCEALSAPPPNSCVRPDPDLSHGPNVTPIIRSSIIPPEKIADGGPGPDGIPPLEAPEFIQNPDANVIDSSALVVGVKIGNETRAYPHNILNWHEVVNDWIRVEGVPQPLTLSYCPLTGSATMWDSVFETGNRSFGTSGLLYNSNLVMYDRETESLWSQMLEQAISGHLVTQIPERKQVVETTWGTWRAMYPETALMSEQTGFSRNYDAYPYGTYREDDRLIFDVDNMDDDRLHRKERVLGINVGTNSRVYPIKDFSNDVEIINDTVGDMRIAVAGSSGLNFGVVFNRELEDCTVLEFEAVQNRLPVVMRDNEGNEWDIFGTAISGARTGQQLQKTNSYIAFWFAWTAFFQNTEIHAPVP